MFWQSRSKEQDRRTCLIAADRNITYHELFDKADQLFEGIDRGLVAILCDKSFETITSYIGALRNNLVPFLLDEKIKPMALNSCLSAYAPRYIFANKTIEPSGYQPIKILGQHALFKRDSIENIELNDKLALLLPTSGSTGDPKCVRLSQKNISTCTHAIVDYLGLQSQHISVSLLPFHYSYGLSVLHNTMHTRASLLLTDLSVLDRPFWALMEKHRVTELSAVPTIFEMIRRMRLSDIVLANLRCVTQAGGKLDPKLTKHFHELFSASDILYFTMYGQTEAGPRISYVPPQHGAKKLGSVGIPINCGSVSLHQDHEDVEEGELIYEGPNVCLGYATNAKDLALGDEFNGVLATGDIAKVDNDGFIYLIGRLKRFVKLQGVSVNLDHVESTIKTAGIDCMVVGADNSLLICFSGDKHEKITEIIGTNFNFHPSHIKLHQLPELPNTSSGKPNYAELASKYL